MMKWVVIYLVINFISIDVYGDEFLKKKIISTSFKRAQPLPNPEKRNFRIAVIALDNNAFWLQVRSGVYFARKKLKQYHTEVHWIVPRENIHIRGISSAIKHAIENRYDAIATIGSNSDIIPAVKDAVKKGIPVAFFNVKPVEESPYLFYVGADSYQQGIDAAKGLIQVMGRTGQIVIMTGFYSVDEHELRRKGFIEYIKKHAPGIKIVAEMENHDDESKAYIQTIEVLRKYPDLKGIYVTAGGPPGVASAITYMKRENLKLIGFDLTPENKEYLKKGVISGILGQNPFAQGYEPAIHLYNYLITGRKTSVRYFFTNEKIIFKKDLKGGGER